ncbi:hypothetical protein IEZ26_02930 [Nocardioides cavernae]|uniref:Uncharacterized protein n=1 Tax=Nocardioides cavernae TaxID=1921566 RepID=A0ABR8N6P7_9ACTN|nr:hypothetical protein [Nocardioides cavernae]MBD3923560.1 hypothetical protein [Nocardioides cavernae]MBM7511511.1 hypothetical protein [Nocardioides cavernae]
MSTDIDWQHELDSSFGTGHDVPAGHYVAAGRTAVRRRRATAVVLAAVVVIGGGTAWAVAPGSTLRGSAPVASEGPRPQQEERVDEKKERTRDRGQPRSVPTMTVAERFGDNPALIEPDGTVKISPLTDVELQRVANPMQYTPEQGRSVGLRVIYQGVETYSLVAMTEDGTSTSTHTNGATGDFPGWLADKVSLQRGLDELNGVDSGTSPRNSPDEWLTLGPEGSLESASPYVAVMEVREGVDLGDSFATGADRSGVARLQFAGTPEYVAWRVVAGRLEVIDGPGSFGSLDAFVSWARQQYASGEGMR